MADIQDTPTVETSSRAQELLDFKEQFRGVLDRLTALEERRVAQSSIPPQTIKSRHLQESISLKTPSISDLTAYANNAAAIAGGLSVGDLYRIGDTVGIVH